jgi:hypothetical protein
MFLIPGCGENYRTIDASRKGKREMVGVAAAIKIKPSDAAMLTSVHSFGLLVY